MPVPVHHVDSLTCQERVIADLLFVVIFGGRGLLGASGGTSNTDATSKIGRSLLTKRCGSPHRGWGLHLGSPPR